MIKDLIAPMTVALGIGIGYILKVSFANFPNRLIPLVCGIVGVVFNIWAAGMIDPQVMVSGLISGLASTGLFEAIRNLQGN